jgi:methyl-accepting chemotaxis protein
MQSDDLTVPLKTFSWANLSIRFKILSVLVPSVIVILFIVFVSFQSSQSSSLTNSKRIMQLIVKSQTAELNSALVKVTKAFENWTNEDVYGLAIEFNTTNELSTHLEGLIQHTPEVGLTLVTDTGGNILSFAANGNYSISNLTGKSVTNDIGSISDSNIQISLSETEGMTFLDGNSSTTYLFTYATKDFMGEVNGYLLCYIDNKLFQNRADYIADVMKDNGMDDARVLFIDMSTDMVISDSDDSKTPALESSLKSWMINSSSNEMEKYRFDGGKNYVVFDRISDLESQLSGGSAGNAQSSAVMASFVPTSNILAKVFSILLINVLIALAGMGLIGLVTFWIARNISRPIKEITDVAEEIARGDLSSSVEFEQTDEIGMLATAFTRMRESLQGKATAATEIAKGNLKVEVNVASDLDVLGQAMLRMREGLQDMQMDLHTTIEGQKVGDLEARCHPDEFEGTYADLLQGVNAALDAVIDPVKEGINILQEYAQGNLASEMRKLPGQQIILTDGLNSIRTNINVLVEEGVTLTTAAEAGNLETRGDTSRLKGSYSQIIMGINSTLENIINPVREAVKSMESMSEGDLTQNMVGKYHGDHAMMKNTLNDTLDRLNDLLTQVADSANQVYTGSEQISGSSQALSQGAIEQAAALQEISSSMIEISSQTKQNAENSREANDLSDKVRDTADAGNSHMKRMLSAVDEINKSSGQISKIIKVIDEIAFQTNLLALNAAVEAARAGVYGKGFAVVAEEVRNLAKRSADAARETTELIEGSIKKAKQGSDIAVETDKVLDEIVQGVSKVSDLVAEISQSSQEQSNGIAQISQSLSQVETVTQSNSANAEEGAAASTELASQAQNLLGMLKRFKLRTSGYQDYSASDGYEINGELAEDDIKLIEDSGQDFNAESDLDIGDLDAEDRSEWAGN